ncbi:mediator of CRAC channel activity domain-containing protein [Ditylenchus destructor]|nr:mediator of CRAC channel activity domain-containing protein [Ditylenchus destructor]
MTATTSTIITSTSDGEEHSLLSSEDELFSTPKSGNSFIEAQPESDNPQPSTSTTSGFNYTITSVPKDIRSAQNLTHLQPQSNHLPAGVPSYAIPRVPSRQNIQGLAYRSPSTNSLNSLASGSGPRTMMQTMQPGSITPRPSYAGATLGNSLGSQQPLLPKRSYGALPNGSAFAGLSQPQSPLTTSRSQVPLVATNAGPASYFNQSSGASTIGDYQPQFSPPPMSAGMMTIEPSVMVSQPPYSAPLQKPPPFTGSRLALNMMSATAGIAIAMTPPAGGPSAQVGSGASVCDSLDGPPAIGSGSGGGGGGRLKTRGGFEAHHLEPLHRHRGELSVHEKYKYDLSRAQLKASSRTSALLAGFAMVALVELQYEETTPKPLLIILGVVTTLLVSVHLLALMMSTCLLPYIEANGCTQDSPHIKLKFYIDLSWLFSTCIGLLLFLLEIGVIFFVKFNAIGYNLAGYITTGMLVPVVIVFIVISYLIHRSRFTHSMDRVNDKVVDLQKFLSEAEVTPPMANSLHRNMVGVGLQSMSMVKNFKDV